MRGQIVPSFYKNMTFKEKVKFLKAYNKLKRIAFNDLMDELKYLRKQNGKGRL